MRRAIAYLVFALFLAPRAAAGQPLELFFYSPEFAPANLGILQTSVEAYLKARHLTAHFQAFARYEDLRSEFAKRQVSFAILPPWIAERQCLGRSLTAIAEPVRNGSSLDRKILVASKHAAGNLRSASVAVSGPRGLGGAAPPLLGEFVSSHPKARIINVPKDVDALLAVSFGQVEAAFVSSAQFETLARINPAMTAMLEETGYTAESPFPRLYATDAATAQRIAEMTEAAVSMGESDDGKRLLRLMGYDQWRPVDAKDRLVRTPCPSDGEETKR